MAASAPIQFTVDQEALKVQDTTVARTPGTGKKRTVPGSYQSSYSAVPRPMYQSKTPNGTPESPMKEPKTPNGVNGNLDGSPETSLPIMVSPSKKTTVSPMKAPVFKADVEEGDSPKLLVVDAPKATSVEVVKLPEPLVNDHDAKEKQEEDGENESKDREEDIYADKVLQCSIENKEACVMCSG